MTQRRRTPTIRALSVATADDLEIEIDAADVVDDPAALTAASATADALDPATIDRTGGRYRAGLLGGTAVVTAGEAIGHDLWLDADFLAACVTAINTTPAGLKCRFTHPGLCADGLGTLLGRLTDARLDGLTVRADLHLTPTAYDTPHGNLGDYVLSLAETDPAACGVSIVYTPDQAAETDFLAAHVTGGMFVSPDPLNGNNLPHARLAKLHAADVVDDPAANPAGMFSTDAAGTDAAAELIDYALGLSADPPRTNPWGLPPDRIRQAVGRRLATRGITLPRPEPAAMPDPTPAPAPAPATTAADAVRLAAEYRDRWGIPGLEYFAAGLTLEAAATAHATAQTAELDRLRAENAALRAGPPRGEPSPVTVADRPETPPARAKFGRDRFAAAITLPR